MQLLDSPSIFTEAAVTLTFEKENLEPPVTPEPSVSSPRRLSTSVNTMMQTPIRPIGSFYRMVYSSSSGEDEDNVPLVQLKRTAFEELMPTPIKVTNKTPTVRKKAINYRGTPVTKDLFDKIKKNK